MSRDKTLIDDSYGFRTYHEYDELTDETIISYEQDSTPILEHNKALANDDDYTKAGIKDGFWHYAEIPNELIVKWLIEDGIDVYDREHAKAVFRKINDPEYLYLRTTSKKHNAR